MILSYVSRTLRPLALAALLAVAAVPASHAAVWPDHVNLAYDWIFDPYIDINFNSYASNPDIWTDSDGKLHAVTKCGSFTALLLKNAYPGVVTDTELTALTGSNSPYADQWYDAIDDEDSDATSGIAFHKRSSAATIAAGDILASAYTVSGDTGHVMTVKSITLAAAGTSLPSGKSVPDVDSVNRYQVEVYDSTKDPHGAYASHPVADTRYKRFDANNNPVYVTDQGIGSGAIAIYEDADTGRIVAWAWNLSPTTTSFYYAVTPNGGGSSYRPMVAGYLSLP